jgi:hypothetical protein
VAHFILAITTGERIGNGLWGILLSLPAFIVWLFAIIGLGFVWRRLNRSTRERSMCLLILGMLVLTLGAVIGMPYRAYDIESLDDPDNPVFAEEMRVGLTAWFVRREVDHAYTPSLYQGPPLPPNVEISSHFSVVGLVSMLPTVVALIWLARWQWRELPKFYRRSDGRCDWCNYDLSGSHSPVCPECGEIIT